jgi:hypothetical protein
MATVSEIIGGMIDRNEYVPPRLIEVRDSTPGLTEELYTNNVLDTLGDTYPRLTGQLERSPDAAIPDYKSIIAMLPKKDVSDDDKKSMKNPRTALDKFVQDFPEKQGEWKKFMMKHSPAMGERGWETVKQVWRNTVHDYYAQKGAEERDRIMEGNAEGQGAHDWLASSIGSFMFPRIKKAGKEGRDPTWQEVTGDVLSNAAYAVPAGYIATPLKAAARGLSPVAQGAAKVATSVLSNAVAPTAVYGMDKALGNETTWLDPVTGTMANLGVNKFVFPAIGARARTLLGKIRNPQLRGVRALLEGADSPRERGLQIIDDANRFLKESERPTEDIVNEFMASGRENPYTEAALDKNRRISEIGDAIRELDNIEGLRQKLTTILEYRNLLNGIKEKPRESVIAANIVENNATENTLKKWLDEAVSTMPERGGDFVEWGKNIKASRKKAGEEIAQRIKNTAAIFKENPELMAALYRNRYPRATDILTAYGINQVGNIAPGPAEQAATSFNIPLKDWIQAAKEERQEDRTSAAASRILDGDDWKKIVDSDTSLSNGEKAVAETLVPGESLTDEDRKYIRAIEKNPDIVKVGHPTDPDGFKTWMLLRGHRLLMGTDASRPTWDVEY